MSFMKQISSTAKPVTTNTVTIPSFDGPDYTQFIVPQAAGMPGTIALCTIVMPDSPLDGQLVTIIATGGALTAVTHTTPVGTIANPITTMTNGLVVKYTWCADQSKWMKH